MQIFFRVILYLRYVSLAVSVFFAIKAIYELTDYAIVTFVIVFAVTYYGYYALIPVYLYHQHCNSDRVTRNQKIIYAIIAKIIQSVGVMGCAILSACVGHDIDFSVSSASYMADFMIAIFFLSFASTFLVDFGFLDVIVAWFLSALWNYDEAVVWLGYKLSIDSDGGARQQAYLIIIIGFTLCLRSLLLSIFTFLDTWAWSDARFCTHLGRFVGYTGNDGGNDGDRVNAPVIRGERDLEAGEGANRINFHGNPRPLAPEGRALAREGRAIPREGRALAQEGRALPKEEGRALAPEGRAFPQEGMRQRVTQSHGDLRSSEVGRVSFDIGIGSSHSASFSVPSQQIQPYRLSILEKKPSFNGLGLASEAMMALREMGISEPTEIQSTGIPAVLKGKSVMLLSNPASGKTLAYLLPLVQLIKFDKDSHGKLIKPKGPRALILCPTVETSQQVFRVAKSISRHASFKPIMATSVDRNLRPSVDSPIDKVIGTLDNALNYGNIKYVVFDQLDSILARGLGPGIITYLRRKTDCHEGIQIVLVSAAKMTEAMNKFIQNECPEIQVLCTSSDVKKSTSARHDFIQLSASDNKLEMLLQVLKSSLARGNTVMVFCSTLVSSRDMDNFLNENQIFTITFHETVTAEQRVEYLEKCTSDDGYCPTLVCTDEAIRGCDLDVEHLIMFDFPSNPIDYMHHSGKLARMGAKGEVTSLVGKADQQLFKQAMREMERLKSINMYH